MRRRTAVALLVAALALTACEQTTRDRSADAGGHNPDHTSDTTDVTVWRNIDNAPNVVGFCADGVRFYTTLSVDGQRQPALVVAPDIAQDCQQ